MKQLLILLLITICSCTTPEHIVISDLNTSGKIKSVKHCHNCESGRFIYKIELNPETHEFISYITNDTLEIGSEKIITLFVE